MSDFIFSVNVTFPIFLVMVIGWVLHQIGMLDEHFVTVANRFNFKVTLPFMLFRDIASVEISKVFDLKFVLYCAIVSSICFWGIWGISKFAVKDDSVRGAFAMGPLMIVGAVPLYNVYSVIVLTFEAQDEQGKRDKGKIKQALVNIVKNPIIDSIFLGLIVSLLGIHFPTIVNKTINSVAQLATPLALIVIGAGFEGRKAIAKIKPTCWAAAIKLVIQPLIFLPVAAYMGFSGEKIIAILIMLASPTTPSCYIMAKSMKNDGVLTASVIVATTLFAAFTLTFWIFLLRTFGLI